MKHILRLILATFVLILIFIPIIIFRWIWTFKWDDKFDGMPRGIFYAYKTSWGNLGKRMKNKQFVNTI